MDNYLTKYLKARDEAVKSMDVEKFKDFLRKYAGCAETIPSDLVIEITMRKMAVHITSIDVDTRVEAFRWLLENGYDASMEE